VKRLVLGSRGSALALAQVELVSKALFHAHPGLEIEVKVITTSGDRRQEVRAGEGGDAGLKGLFTKEIQEALLDGSIAAAVHSLKDLPGIVPAGLSIAAVLPRADTADVLVTRSPASLASLPRGARIGTGSVRRRRQLLWQRADVEVVDLRGNVPTRLRKLGTESLAAIVLARAGLDRLGYTIDGDVLRLDAGVLHAARLDILPAIGQGAIGIETRCDATEARELLAAIDDSPTHICIRAERELLRLLDGDCRLPVAARVTLDDCATLHGEALVFPENDDSAPPAHAAASGPALAPEQLALALFQQLA
jgi:hydroxymethylbilane synthase